MIRTERHDDVRRHIISWWRSRSVGYDVSVYAVRGVLVDCAFPGAAADVDRVLAAERPEAVIVTHQHEDHAGNVDRVAVSGTALVMSAATRNALASQPPMGAYRRFAWGSWRGLDAAAGAATEPRVEAMELVPTPGHSDDHHVVLDTATGTVFGGDLYLGVKVRVARPGEDPRALAASLRRIAALGPARFFCAHRGPVPDPAATLGAKADWIEETIGRIESLAARGWAPAAIRDEVLGREPWTTLVTAGDLSRLNLVRAVLESSGQGRGDPRIG